MGRSCPRGPQTKAEAFVPPLDPPDQREISLSLVDSHRPGVRRPGPARRGFIAPCSPQLRPPFWLYPLPLLRLIVVNSALTKPEV